MHKYWDDNNDELGIRPSSIYVQLLANGKEVRSATLTAPTWAYRFTELDAVDDAGESITYTVTESAVEGYEVSYSGTDIKNKVIPPTPKAKRTISGTKIWEDNNDADHKRPAYIEITLRRDGKDYKKQTVSAGNNWSYTFKDLPVDNGYGHTYTYTFREKAVSGYYSRVEGTNIINSRLPSDKAVTRNSTSDEEDEEFIDYPTPLAGRMPELQDKTMEELEEFVDVFSYGTPLFGEPLKTGDETPIYPFVFGGIGVLAVVLLLVFGRKRKKNEAKR